MPIDVSYANTDVTASIETMRLPRGWLAWRRGELLTPAEAAPRVRGTRADAIRAAEEAHRG